MYLINIFNYLIFELYVICLSKILVSCKPLRNHKNSLSAHSLSHWEIARSKFFCIDICVCIP